jgi:hypothetical protein
MTRMITNNLKQVLSSSIGAALLAVVLTGCGKAPAPAEPATPPASNEAPTNPAPANEVSPPDTAAPAPSPAPAPPPPTEPSAVPKPTSTAEPSLDSMHAAIPSAKMSVAVDLRYQIDGEALPGQPVTVRLAAVPRVAGTRLQVVVKQVSGLQVATGPLEVQKTTAAGVYRQTLSITRSNSGPQSLRVLVTMDIPEGSGFGYFTVPLADGNSPQKQQSVKQR